MKKLLLLLLVSAMSFEINAQTNDDPVIMHINGNAITRSEFEYSFNKNNSDGVLDKKGLEEYVDLFINFKLKVEAAKAAGIDTMASIRKELDGYREQMVMQDLVDSNYIEAEARKVYDATAKRFEGQDLLQGRHIFVYLPQNADAAAQTKAKAKIDSLYSVLLAGADFEEIARNYSEDKQSAVKGGSLGEFAKGMMIPDFEKAAYALKVGEVSKPVQTTVGWHIIRIDDRHPFRPYEYHRADILKFLDQRGVREASANAMVDSLAKKNGVTRSEVIKRMYADIILKDADTRYLAQEYYDGTLMYEISKTLIWDKAAADTLGLQRYFEQHRSDYAWTDPHFRGIVIHAKNKKTLAAAKKLTKKVKYEDWATTIVKALNNDSVKLVRIDRGIFKPGDSKAVDKFVFKTTKEFTPMKDYPFTDVLGKSLKAPETYADVKALVTADYQAACEREWVEELRKTYTFSVDEDVLRTVNAHGDKEK